MHGNDPTSKLLDAIATVQAAAEHSSPTQPAKVTQTLAVSGPSPVKGRKYPATPPDEEEARLVKNEIFNASHTRGKWAVKWGPMRLRNRCVVETIHGSGLRIHEVLLLRPADLDFEANQVLVRRGKGGKRRISAITQEALSWTNVWMHVWDALGFTVEQDDLLYPVLEGPTRGGMLEQGYIRKCLHENATAAGVVKRVTPHQWRHAHAIHLDRHKVSIGHIQRQLGHSSPATTGIYLAGISNADVTSAVLEAFK